MTYEPQLALRDYQLEALEKMRTRQAFALLMAMRTGKTATLLADFGRLEQAGEISDLLVVAPKGVYRTWLGEIEKHLSRDLLARLSVGLFDSAKKFDAGLLANLNGPRVLLMNIEALQQAGRAREICEAFVGDRRAMIAVDESTTIKNPKAIRTRYMVRVLGPRAACRRILSGLPTPRSPLDIFCQFEFLQPGLLGFMNYMEFQYRYAITKKVEWGGRRFSVVVGHRNIDDLQRRVERHSHRVEFRPQIPSTYSIREVTMTEHQRRMYSELKTHAVTRLEEAGPHVSASIVITQMLRMHQVLCGHVRDEEGNLHVVEDNKTSELLELLEDYAGKAVIWCSYDHDVRKISQALAKEYDAGCVVGHDRFGKEIRRDPAWPNPVVARFWGGNQATREEEELAFKTSPACRFMVATPSAGGRGRTWDAADLVVYHSSTNNLEHRDQSEQRVQGVGKERQVDYVDLVCPGTIEEKILQALRGKIDLAAALTGDAWREWIV
jgi:hypothetical protein